MDLAHFALNVGAAMLMGMAIGLERQIGMHMAGLRTHTLVSLGAALFVSLSLLMDRVGDPTRVAGQVVSGLGFLGGGVILREGFNVRGMNTAATLWCSGAIGTLAGAGLLAQGAIGTVAVVATNLLLRPVVRFLNRWRPALASAEIVYRVRVVCRRDEERVIRAIVMRHVNAQPNLQVQGLSIQDAENADEAAVIAEVFSSGSSDKYMNDLVSRLGIETSVSGVSWERKE